MIDPSILDNVFTALSDLKGELNMAIITLHEDGYHQFSAQLGNICTQIERKEREVADLYETISNLKGAKQ